MKRRLIILLVGLGMLALLGGAVAWDCLRIAGNHRERITLADEDLKKHEQRLVTLLRGSPEVSPEVEASIVAYEAAEAPTARHAAYDEVVAAFRKTMGTRVDATNPLDRKFMDDVAGAINRREIARDPYDVESMEYRRFLVGIRGRVARWLSSQSQTDYAAMGK